MSIRTSPWPAGVPCWVDLNVRDVGAARAFYGPVLGWSFQDTGDEYGGYVIAERRGAAAAGIGPQQYDGPSAWTVYFASDDADTTAETITQNSGTLIAPPGDVGPLGRLLIAADPTGAVFGVWQAGEHIGAGLVNEPGGLTWEDLRSPDPTAARTFYGALFGYRTDPVEMAGEDYTTFQLPDESFPLGGIGGMMGAESAPAHWIAYFGVADADAAVAAAEHGGGRVVMPAFDTPYGRMAALADPAGAAFQIIVADADNQPDRSG
jgi:predicted enzyme related to lactoylglutathione lyase